MPTSDTPIVRGTVTLYLCLLANGRCGLWYASERAAMANRTSWDAVYPVEIPAAIYAGFPIAGSVVVDEEALADRESLEGGARIEHEVEL